MMNLHYTGKSCILQIFFFFQEHIELEILNLLYSKCNLALEIRKSAGLGSVGLHCLLL